MNKSLDRRKPVHRYWRPLVSETKSTRPIALPQSLITDGWPPIGISLLTVRDLITVGFLETTTWSNVNFRPVRSATQSTSTFDVSPINSSDQISTSCGEETA